MKICFDLITKIIFTYSYILRKKKYCQDYKMLINRENSDVISMSSENDSHEIQICEEPLDLSINDPVSKRLKLDLKDNEITNESKEEDNLIKVIVENDNPTNELTDTHLIEVYANAELSTQKEKGYLSFSCITNLHSIIEQYVTRSMKKTYLSFYLLRFSKIYQTHKVLTDNINELENFKYIFKTYNTKILAILHSICSQFDNVEFSEMDCKNFLEKLSDMINSENDLRPLLNQIDVMHFKNRIFIFYAEFMKCSKYFGDIPELMTLGGICSENSTCNLILTVHLINLLLDTTKKIAEIKVFILFLIRQSFANSFKSRFKFSSVHVLHIKCPNNYDILHHNNLHFFLWEMNKSRRGTLLVKLYGKHNLSLSQVDRIHFKTVLLMFIFQQIIFLKLNNVVLEESKKYVQLIHNIIKEDNCPVCDLNTFLELFKI